MPDSPATPEQHALVTEAIGARMKRDMQPQSDPVFDQRAAELLARIQLADRYSEEELAQLRAQLRRGHEMMRATLVARGVGLNPRLTKQQADA